MLDRVHRESLGPTDNRSGGIIMKVKGLKVTEKGTLQIDGKQKDCPHYNVLRNCGDWCALFTIERPSDERIRVSLNCSAGTVYESY
jgi:hypothetical protein